MIRVHPEYDVEREEWFVPGQRRLRARSLRALQAKLEDDAEIEGYYPNGAPPYLLHRGLVAGSSSRLEHTYPVKAKPWKRRRRR